MKRNIAVAVPLAAGLAFAALSTPARAQSNDAQALSEPAAEARRQYNLGTQAYAAHRFADAAQNFEAAAAYKAHAVTLYTAALAWDQAGQPERAADDFGRALDVGGLSADQTRNAKERLAALERTAGTAIVKAPAGWRVQLDTLTEVPAPARLHATPGLHSLNYHPAGEPAKKKELTLEAGKTQSIELPEKEAPPPKEDPAPVAEKDKNAAPVGQPAESSATKLRRSLGFAAVGVGVAGLGAGIILGLEANDARDTFNTAPAHATFDHAKGLQTWTNVALVTGGVFLAGGLALVLIPTSEKTQVKLGLAPGGASMRGTF